MTTSKQKAHAALDRLLWELPAEFSHEDPNDPDTEFRPQFSVIKSSNVRKVHRALWELQEYFKEN